MKKSRKITKPRRPNPEAQRLADARFRQRVVEDKRRKADDRRTETEMRNTEVDGGIPC